jgi:hypothetical protein
VSKTCLVRFDDIMRLTAECALIVAASVGTRTSAAKALPVNFLGGSIEVVRIMAVCMTLRWREMEFELSVPRHSKLCDRDRGMRPENRFASDSLLEERGFEPSVPRDTTKASRAHVRRSVPKVEVT